MKEKMKFSEWIANFWYHHKLFAVVVLVALVILGFWAKSILDKPNPDLTMVVATSNTISADQLQGIEQTMESTIR